MVRTTELGKRGKKVSVRARNTTTLRRILVPTLAALPMMMALLCCSSHALVRYVEPSSSKALINTSDVDAATRFVRQHLDNIHLHLATVEISIVELLYQCQHTDCALERIIWRLLAESRLSFPFPPTYAQYDAVIWIEDGRRSIGALDRGSGYLQSHPSVTWNEIPVRAEDALQIALNEGVNFLSLDNPYTLALKWGGIGGGEWDWTGYYLLSDRFGVPFRIDDMTGIFTLLQR